MPFLLEILKFTLEVAAIIAMKAGVERDLPFWKTLSGNNFRSLRDPPI